MYTGGSPLKLPPLETLLHIYEIAYNEHGHGHLRWRIDPNSITPYRNMKRGIGEWVGYVRHKTGRSRGYIAIRYKNVVYLEHRLIWKMANGKDPLFVIDHIDHNVENNSPSNLREVLPYKNLQHKKNRTSEERCIHAHERGGYIVSPMSLMFYDRDLAIEYRDKMETLLLPLYLEYREKNLLARDRENLLAKDGRTIDLDDLLGEV